MASKMPKGGWFHSIALPDGRITPGRFGPATPANYTLFGALDLLRHVDLGDARCFDIGAMDGVASFALKQLGAGSVTACDMAPRETFRFAREALGLEVDYQVPVNALELPELVGDRRADLILMAGVLYHVYDPLTVLVALRDALAPGGLLVLETLSLFDEGRPVMSFNPVDRSRRHVPFPHIYWRASKAAVHGMLQLASFQVLATRMVNARLTVIAEARRPEELDSRATEIVNAQDHHRHQHYREAADFDALAERSEGRAAVRYHGPRDDRFLYRGLFEPPVPCVPRWEPSARVRARDLARSARMHAAMRLAETRERARFTRR